MILKNEKADAFTLKELKEKVLQGELIGREEALALCNEPLEELCQAADEIREHFCKDGFDMCSIINGKSGKCSENCKYCAQSSFYHTSAEEYPLLDTEEIVNQAKYNASKGVQRYSIVTSGRCLTDAEVGVMCKTVQEIKRNVEIEVCVSFGLLNEGQFQRLKRAGVVRVHNNLETSRSNFHNICTTHGYDDKIAAIKAAQNAGLSVCSKGIFGLGETWEDRIDMAISLKKLNIMSVPINMLNPIPGTPYEKNNRLNMDDMRRIVAIYRFILPKAAIRLAGGRGLLEDKGEGCFRSGANAVISGDMLTTAGYTIHSDMDMIHRLGYQMMKPPMYRGAHWW